VTDTRLRLAPELVLPAEAVTQTFAILAKRGAGKTYTALALVEELLRVSTQVVVADPVGPGSSVGSASLNWPHSGGRTSTSRLACCA